MRYSKLLPVATGALLVASIYSARAAGDKEAVRQATEALIQAKKAAARAQALRTMEIQDAGSQTGHRSRVQLRLDEPLLLEDTTPIRLLPEGSGQEQNLTAAGRALAPGIDELCINFNGVVESAGDVDVYQSWFTQGDLVEVSIVSDGAGVGQDPLIRVFGPLNFAGAPDCSGLGPPLATSDDGYRLNGTTLDPCTYVRIPATGLYFIEVSDLVGLAGGYSQTYSGKLCVGITQEMEPNTMATPNTLRPHTFMSAFSGLEDFVGAIASGGGKSAQVTSAGVGNGVAGCVTNLQTATIYGRIQSNNDVDCYRFGMVKNEITRISVLGGQCANNLGPVLDPEITAYAPGGEVLAVNDDADGVDPSLLITAQTTGNYTVCIRDHFNRGGDTFIYKLTVSQSSLTENIDQQNGSCLNATPTCEYVTEGTCIASLTLKNTRTGKVQTFQRDSTWRSDTTYTIDGNSGTFHVSCSRCIKPGDVSGFLQIIYVFDPSGRVAQRCIGK